MRHNPYGYPLISREQSELAEKSFLSVYGNGSGLGSSEDFTESSPGPMATFGSLEGSTAFGAETASCSPRSPAPKESLELSGNDDGVSEVSSEDLLSGAMGSTDPVVQQRLLARLQQRRQSLPSDASGSQVPFTPLDTPQPTAAPALLQLSRSMAPPTVFRYASVNFRFGSAWFLAPFRTNIGAMVVVEYPGNNQSQHMGLVSYITTVKPDTFYSEDNLDPNYLTEEEIATLPRLLRHAREFDKETKLDLRQHDLHSLKNAQLLAAEMGAPVEFRDAEWLLDLSAVTFLVHVFRDDELVDRLADALAAQEGAEVVFTYPATNALAY